MSSSASPFSFCLQNFPASGSFPMSRLFISGGQNSAASSLVLPMNIQGWFPLGLIYIYMCVCIYIYSIYMEYNTMEYHSARKKKELNFAICNNMDGLGGYYAEWNKSDIERQILDDITDMWDLKQYNQLVNITKSKQTHRHRKQTSGYSVEREGKGAI